MVESPYIVPLLFTVLLKKINDTVPASFICLFCIVLAHGFDSLLILSHLCCYNGCMSNFHIRQEKMYLCLSSVSKQTDNSADMQE